MKKARLPALGLLALLAACAAPQKVAEAPPEELYQQAVTAVEKREYDKAQRILDRLRDDAPFSKVAVDAELLGADSLFKQEKYEEAAAAYKNFTELHPTHAKASWAEYRRGLSHLKLAQRADRDQTATRQAAEAFQKLLNADPKGEYAEEARQRLAQVRASLASHELYVARYYVRRKKYDAALERLQVVLRNYPDSPAGQEATKLVAELDARKK